MSESTSPMEGPSPLEAPSRRINWHRVRVYLLSLLIIFTMWLCAALITIRQHPERLVNALLARLPCASSTGNVYWVNRRTLQIDNVKLGDFFYADSVVVTASPMGLLRHHIAKFQIIGGQLFVKRLYAVMERAGAGSGSGIDWAIGRLEISRGALILNDIVADTSIRVGLGLRQPIILRNLRLDKPDSSPQMAEVQTAEIVNVNIVSPKDPLVPVFFFPLIRVRFTYSEIWQHQIREVEMVRPTMFLGEDLFLLAKEFKSDIRPTSSQGPAAPWEIAHLEVQYGQLAVNVFGQPIAHLPFFFGTKVSNIRFDQLDQISAKATIPIYRLDQDYPDYKIRLVGLTGQLFFSWPPTDATADNVINRVKIEEISWNDIPVTAVDTTVTFDPTGIYGKLTNGTCEGGRLNGNFEFYYTKGFTWNVDFSAENINCQPIAEKLVGKYFNLTGQLNGKIAVQGKATDILNCRGVFDLPNPGLLEIKSMDDLLNRLPPDLIAMKRDALKIVIDNFKTYPYERGQLKIDYNPAGGVSTLKLTGPGGKRQFAVYLHPWSSSDQTSNRR